MTPLTRILDHLELSGVSSTPAPGTHTGIIVTLAVPQDVAAHLAVPDGERADELHITLAFMGSSADLTPADVSRYETFARELEALGQRTPPLSLTITGADTFRDADESGHAHHLTVDGPGLRALREQVMTIAEGAGLTPSRKYPTFNPHVTLRYSRGPHPDPAPPRLAFTVPDVQLWMGGRHLAFPLAPTMAKAQQAPTPGTAAARHLLATLTGDLMRLHHQDTQLRAHADGLAAHHLHAGATLAHAIRAPRGSAVEDAYLAHADDARAARALASL